MNERIENNKSPHCRKSSDIRQPHAPNSSNMMEHLEETRLASSPQMHIGVSKLIDLGEKESPSPKDHIRVIESRTAINRVTEPHGSKAMNGLRTSIDEHRDRVDG